MPSMSLPVMSLPVPSRNDPSDLSDLITKFASARILVTQLDGVVDRWIDPADARNSDRAVVEEIRRRRREEPMFAERMRQPVKEFSALLARTVSSSYTPRISAETHVVIIGGGFGGLYAARRLRKAAVRITLVDRHNYHLFQPLLYQVATAALNPSDIAAPIRGVLRRQKNVSVILGDATSIDTSRKIVTLSDGELAYELDEVREALTLAPDVLLTTCAARASGSTSTALQDLVSYTMKHLTVSYGPGFPT